MRLVPYGHRQIDMIGGAFFPGRGIEPVAVRRAVPVGGVFFLRHGAAELVEPLGGAAAIHLWESVLQALPVGGSRAVNRHLRHRTRLFENTGALAGAVPISELRLSLTGRFWESIERSLEAS